MVIMDGKAPERMNGCRTANGRQLRLEARRQKRHHHRTRDDAGIRDPDLLYRSAMRWTDAKKEKRE